jgi:hypothetical protein
VLTVQGNFGSEVLNKACLIIHVILRLFSRIYGFRIRENTYLSYSFHRRIAIYEDPQENWPGLSRAAGITGFGFVFITRQSACGAFAGN